MEKKLSAIIFGLIIVGAGVGYAADALGYIDNFTIFFDGWWTCFIIVPAFCSLFNRGSNKFGSLAIMALGVGLLLWQQDVLNFPIGKLILPAVAIIGGLSIIVSAFTGGKHHNNGGGDCSPVYPEDGSLPEYSASFGSVRPNYNGQIFAGCKLEASFGSAVLDLRGALLEGESTIIAEASFGGIEIYLPQSCKLDLHSSASFGGVENKFVSATIDPNAPVVHINANAAFGGVEVK